MSAPQFLMYGIPAPFSVATKFISIHKPRFKSTQEWALVIEWVAFI